ncbi:hypothetical protein PMI15_03958, partial [Polaromonas sp. CF318]
MYLKSFVAWGLTIWVAMACQQAMAQAPAAPAAA